MRFGACVPLSVVIVVGAQAGVAIARVPPQPPELVPTQAPQAASAAEDDDPLYSSQWGLESTGQMGALVDADIDVEAAWELTEGAPEILVGVLDTGVDVTHPDLVEVLWVNEAELAGVAGVDDDANGCVDDIHGCWFSQGCTEDTPDCTPDAVGAQYDYAGHGTAVAGIIAAAARNGEGGRGVAPRVRVVVLHVATPEGLFWDEPVYRALEYAAAIGVDVINISAFFDGPDLAFQDEGLSLATASGALIVSSAGNWGVDIEAHAEDLPYLPNQSENSAIMRVAAVDKFETLISYAGWWGSCYGPTRVQVAGPSQAIVTTATTTNGGEPYTYTFNGTSASAPFASGVAALVLAANPELSAQEVIQVMMDSSEPLPALAGKIVSGGRLNAANAVRAAIDMGALPVPVLTAPPTALPGEQLAFTAAGSTDPDGGGLRYLWDFGDGDTATGEVVTHTFSAGGLYFVTLEVVAESGMRATARTEVSVDIPWSPAGIELQSPHPYTERLVNVVTIPDATVMRFHFARLELATVPNDFVGDDDSILILDDTGTPVWSTSETAQDFWTPPLPIYNGTAYVLLNVDIGGAWGMHIDQIESDSTLPPEPVNPESDAQADCGCAASGGTIPSGAVAGLSVLWVCCWGRRRRQAR